MTRLHFESDYIEGCHPQILKRLIETNFEKSTGYGTDVYCDSAKAKIRAAIRNPEADIYFLVGGTQSNATVIDALLDSYEGVLAADSGHVSVHEAGAVEQSAHKVLTIPNKNGKLSAESVENYLKVFYADENHEHMVPPGIVYISYPTESGTLYSKKELKDLYEVCQSYHIYLFVDGARLGYGLASDPDMDIADIAEYSDVFYIGGTKVGALLGEAVVFKNKEMCPHFFTIMKRHGALLAKGRVLGIQFDTLFTDGLYEKISAHAIQCADRLEAIFREKGYPVYYESPTNQKFILLSNAQMEDLHEKIGYSFWERIDEDHCVVRLATSWATREEDIEALKEIL